MTDLITQTRDYLEAVRTPVTPDSIVHTPVSPVSNAPSIRKGPMVALAAAALVIMGGLVTLLLQPPDAQLARFEIVNEVIAGEAENTFYTVGFDSDWILCAVTGTHVEDGRQSQGVCGDADQPDAPAYKELAATAYQGDSSVAIAGWVPTSAATVTVIYNGENRRTLQLTPVPGFELHAFGTVEAIQARFIELEIQDENGEITQRYFPSIGPSD